jgi:hypothetical protein
MEPTYFAQLDSNNTVINVIVATNAYISTSSGTYQQTYIDGSQFGKYASLGDIWDPINRVFKVKSPAPPIIPPVPLP